MVTREILFCAVYSPELTRGKKKKRKINIGVFVHNAAICL